MANYNDPDPEAETGNAGKSLNDLFGKYRGKVTIPNDIIQPETDEWYVYKNNPTDGPKDRSSN
jgi:hypothetical protein